MLQRPPKETTWETVRRLLAEWNIQRAKEEAKRKEEEERRERWRAKLTELLSVPPDSFLGYIKKHDEELFNRIKRVFGELQGETKRKLLLPARRELTWADFDHIVNVLKGDEALRNRLHGLYTDYQLAVVGAKEVLDEPFLLYILQHSGRGEFLYKTVKEVLGEISAGAQKALKEGKNITWATLQELERALKSKGLAEELVDGIIVEIGELYKTYQSVRTVAKIFMKAVLSPNCPPILRKALRDVVRNLIGGVRGLAGEIARGVAGAMTQAQMQQNLQNLTRQAVSELGRLADIRNMIDTHIADYLRRLEVRLDEAVGRGELSQETRDVILRSTRTELERSKPQIEADIRNALAVAARGEVSPFYIRGAQVFGVPTPQLAARQQVAAPILSRVGSIIQMAMSPTGRVDENAALAELQRALNESVRAVVYAKGEEIYNKVRQEPGLGIAGVVGALRPAPAPPTPPARRETAVAPRMFLPTVRGRGAMAKAKGGGFPDPWAGAKGRGRREVWRWDVSLPKQILVIFSWWNRLTEREREKLSYRIHRYFTTVDKEERAEALKELVKVAQGMGIPVK